MIYSLIPAYTGSTRLPGKNTFKFMLNGQPLIRYTINELNRAGFRPYLFTNESDVKVSDDYITIKRSDDISTPRTTMNDTVKRFIDLMELKEDDIILLTYLTCPLRTAEDITKALDQFRYVQHRCNSLQSVSPVNYRPYGLMKIEQEHHDYCDMSTILHKCVCLQNQKEYYQKQNTPTLYRANGAIYIFKVSELDKFNNQMFNKNTEAFILDEIHGLDIDTKLDFMVAEKILEERKREHFINQSSNQGVSETKYHPNWTRTDFERTETSRT